MKRANAIPSSKCPYSCQRKSSQNFHGAKDAGWLVGDSERPLCRYVASQQSAALSVCEQRLSSYPSTRNREEAKCGLVLKRRYRASSRLIFFKRVACITSGSLLLAMQPNVVRTCVKLTAKSGRSFSARPKYCTLDLWSLGTGRSTPAQGAFSSTQGDVSLLTLPCCNSSWSLMPSPLFESTNEHFLRSMAPFSACTVIAVMTGAMLI